MVLILIFEQEKNTFQWVILLIHLYMIGFTDTIFKRGNFILMLASDVKAGLYTRIHWTTILFHY